MTQRRTILTETAIVLGVSLGASAVWSVLDLIRKLTAPVPLASQTTAMNTSVVPDRRWLDLAYQLAGIALALVPVALALYLLARVMPQMRQRTGFDLSTPWRDLGRGLGLALLIGVPGLLFYLLARQLGINTTISAANLGDVWWAVPVLVLAAIQNALLEEVVGVAYLFTRWAQAGWSAVTILVTSALIRGSYHLYQGFGGFLGNAAMGLLLGWVYLKTRRVLPLVIAHAILDIAAFVGYAVLSPRVDWL